MRQAETLLQPALAALAGQDAQVAHRHSSPWSSATFSGARHSFSVDLPSPRARLFGNRLPEHDFILPGHIVADIGVTSRHAASGRVTVILEVLTIEAC
jgi:hypothetical protein